MDRDLLIEQGISVTVRCTGGLPQVILKGDLFMNVQQLMKSKVKSCSRVDTLNHAAQLMWEGDCGCVPIVDKDIRVVGILTDRDICMAAYTQGKALWELPVELAMSKKVWTIRPEETIAAAETLLAEKKVRRLPVVDATGRLVGVLSLNDIAREAARERGEKRKAISDAEVGETVAAICESRTAPVPRMVSEQPSRCLSAALPLRASCPA